MKESKGTVRYVIAEDGKILTRLEDGDRIIRKKSSDYLGNKELVDYSQDKSFFKVYNDSIASLIKEGLTAVDSCIFLYLCSNVKYQTNIVKLSNGSIMYRSNIVDQLNLPLVSVKRSITKLIKKNLIAEIRTASGKCFIVNPYIAGVGNKLCNVSLDIFKSSIYRW